MTERSMWEIALENAVDLADWDAAYATGIGQGAPPLGGREWREALSKWTLHQLEQYVPERNNVTFLSEVLFHARTVHSTHD